MKLSSQHLRRRSSHLLRVRFATITILLLTNLIPLAATGIFCVTNCGDHGGMFQKYPDEKQLRRFTKQSGYDSAPTGTKQKNRTHQTPMTIEREFDGWCYE